MRTRGGQQPARGAFDTAVRDRDSSRSGGPTQAMRTGHETHSRDRGDAQRGHNIVREIESLVVRPEVLEEQHSAHVSRLFTVPSRTT
jgi:hypothetical protein